MSDIRSNSYHIGKFSATADMSFTAVHIFNMLTVPSHVTFVTMGFSE